MKRRILSIIMTVVVSASLLVGCGKTEAAADAAKDKTAEASAAETSEGAETTEEATTETAAGDEFEGEGLNEAKVVRIGFMPSSTTAQISAAKGYIDDALKEYGIEAEYTTVVTGPPAIEGLTVGDLDLTFIGNLPVFTGVSNGSPIKAIYKSPASDGGIYGIVVPDGTDIVEAKDLAGKKIAVVIGTAANAYLEILLGTVGLTLDDITIINVAPADVATVIANGEADAGVLWDPLVIKAAKAIGGSVILRPNGLTEDQMFIVGNDTFLAENPLIASVVVTGAIKADEFLMANPEESIKIITEATGDEADEWDAINHLHTTVGFAEIDYETAEQVKDFLKRNDLLQAEFDVHDIFIDKYWDKALELSK